MKHRLLLLTNPVCQELETPGSNLLQELEPLTFLLDTTMNEEYSEPIATVMYHQQLRLDTMHVLSLLQHLLHQSKSKK